MLIAEEMKKLRYEAVRRLETLSSREDQLVEATARVREEIKKLNEFLHGNGK